jgi:ferredoxin-NADP reductase
MTMTAAAASRAQSFACHPAAFMQAARQLFEA